MSKIGKLLSVGQFLMTLAVLLIVVSSTYDVDIWTLVGFTGIFFSLIALAYGLIYVDWAKVGD